MAGGAESETYPYDKIRPYLTSLISGEYHDTAFLHLRRICEVHVKDHPEDICRILLSVLGKVADFMAAEPHSRGWTIYDLNDFFDLLATHCEENCVLDGIDLMANYKRRIPQISGRQLAAILEKSESARAQDLRERHRDALDE